MSSPGGKSTISEIFLPKPKNDPSFGIPAMFEWATREMTAEAKAKEDAEVAAGRKFRLWAGDELTPAEKALFDLWEQPSGEGGLEEVLRKSAELK
ncbi:MAG: hypothetical protein LBU23_04725, partial [Planctomycetota bacterium]|nr:hypothetical protein [Planctomycetota bacterium]